MTILDRARRYIAALPHATSGSDGSTATFNVALALVKGFGLPEHIAMDELRAWNLTHADPPWSDAELLHKIKDATRSNKPLGYLLRDHERNGTSTSSSFSDDEVQRRATLRKFWPSFRPLSNDTMREIATLRHLPLEAVHIAHDAGLLRGAEYEGHRCFIITEGTFAQARRLDGGTLSVPSGEAKAKNLPGSQGAFIGKTLLGGTGATGPAGSILLVEGCIGLLEGIAAALAVDADTSGWTILAATSASSRFDSTWLDRLSGRRVRILPDQDDAGFKACGIWAAALGSVGCHVDAQNLPDHHHDLGSVLLDLDANRNVLADLFAL